MSRSDYKAIIMQSLWMLGASFFFSLMGVCIKLASEHHNLGEIILFRGVPSVLLLAGYALYKGYPLFGKNLRTHAIRNASGVTAMWMGFYGMTHLPLGMSTTLNYTSPLFIAIALLYTGYYSGILREQWLRFGAIVLGFIGVLLIFNPFGETDWNRFAMLIGLCGGAFGALAYLTVRNLGQLGEPEWRTVMLFSVSVILSGVVGVAVLGFSPHYSLYSILVLAGVGIFGMIAQLCMTRAFGHGHATLSATLQYTTIIFATIWGEVIWRERIDLMGFLGMVLVIVAGLSATVYSLKHKQ